MDSMYKILTELFQIDLDHAMQTIRTVPASKQIARKLEISPSVPCLYIESPAHTSENKCIEVLRKVHVPVREFQNYMRRIAWDDTAKYLQ